MKLEHFDKKSFNCGRPLWIKICWIILEGVFYSSWLPGSVWRRYLLQAFGARIGRGVVLKARMRVKFPWRLEIGHHTWLGESVWIDNLSNVKIGSNVCLSQGAYICTGNHDYKDENFKLITKPVVIEDGSWVAAFARIAPGVTIRENSVISLGAVVKKDTEAGKVYSGNPATAVKERFSSKG